jgi:hypothetical protein
LFSRIVEKYSIEKASLLVEDHHCLRFLPIASTALDVTTRRHLRLPSDLLSSHPQIADGTPLTIEGDDLIPFESYFSSREYDLLRHIKIVPLRRNRRVIALFLVLSSTSHESFDLSLLSAELSKFEPEFITAYYEPRLDLAELPTDFGDHDLSSLIDSRIASANRNRYRLLCMKISFIELVKQLVAEQRCADPDHTADDLLRLLCTFVEPSGSILSANAETLILCYAARHLSDPRFFLDHIRTMLEKFYPTTRPLSLPLLASVTCPEDASDSTTLLARLGLTHDA